MPKPPPDAIARMAEAMAAARPQTRRRRGRPRGSGDGPTLPAMRALAVVRSYEAAMLEGRGQEAALAAAAAEASAASLALGGRPVDTATVERILARYYPARSGAVVLRSARVVAPVLEAVPGESYRGARVYREVPREVNAISFGARPRLPRRPPKPFAFGRRKDR